MYLPRQVLSSVGSCAALSIAIGEFDWKSCVPRGDMPTKMPAMMPKRGGFEICTAPRHHSAEVMYEEQATCKLSQVDMNANATSIDRLLMPGCSAAL